MIDVTPSLLNELIKGKRDMNDSLAMKLENQLGIPHTIWMKLQNSYNYDSKAIEQRATEEHEAHNVEQPRSNIFNINIVHKGLNIQSLPH